MNGLIVVYDSSIFIIQYLYQSEQIKSQFLRIKIVSALTLLPLPVVDDFPHPVCPFILLSGEHN